jgi:Skp family chaperone for outer membrane proteins
MTRRQAGRCFAGLAVASVLAASATAQTSEPKARPLLVGVVDLGVIFFRYQRTAEIGREVDRDRDRMEARNREQRRAIEGIRKELDAIPEGTRAYREKAAELQVAQKALEAMRAESEVVVKQRFETLTLQVFDEIDAAVHEFAKANDYDLIVKTTTKGWGEKGLPERIYRAQVSTVVAYDPKLDVTEAILGQLNDADNMKKKSSP